MSKIRELLKKTPVRIGAGATMTLVGLLGFGGSSYGLATTFMPGKYARSHDVGHAGAASWTGITLSSVLLAFGLYFFVTGISAWRKGR
jgi:hypothetical protein